ncbi:MAG: hypothetical protein AAF945_02200 [Actinomycetota bacterium]
MNLFTAGSTVDHTGALCALRKATLLTHWIPGLGMTICQPTRAPIRVIGFDHDEPFDGVTLDPCSFRGLLLHQIDAHRVGLSRMFDPGAELRLKLFADGRTKVNDHGMTLHPLHDGTVVISFASLVAPEDCESVSRQSPIVPTPLDHPARQVDFASDPELGVVLAHTRFDASEPDAVCRASHLMLDLLTTFGGAEAVQQFEYAS